MVFASKGKVKRDLPPTPICQMSQIHIPGSNYWCSCSFKNEGDQKHIRFSLSMKLMLNIAGRSLPSFGKCQISQTSPAHWLAFHSLSPAYPNITALNTHPQYAMSWKFFCLGSTEWKHKKVSLRIIPHHDFIKKWESQGHTLSYRWSDFPNPLLFSLWHKHSLATLPWTVSMYIVSFIYIKSYSVT